MTYIVVIGSLLVYFVLEYGEYHADDTPDSFFLYNRQMPENKFVWTFVATNVGLYSSILFSVGLSFCYGIAGMFWTTLAWFLGMYWFSKKIPIFLEFFKRGFTLHEYIAEKCGSTDEEKTRIRFFTSVVTSILYFASLGVEVKIGADVLAPSLGGQTNSTLLAFAIAITAFAYTYFAGYRGVVYTDKIQYWMMAIGSVFIVAFLSYFFLSEPLELPSSFFSWRSILLGPDWFAIASLCLLVLVYQFCVMDMWQRCIAIAKTNSGSHTLDDQLLVKKMQQLTFRKSILPFLWLFVVWFAIGIAALGFKWTDDPNKILESFLRVTLQFGALGQAIKSIVILVFVSAIISTVDSMLIAVVQTFMYDIYATRINPELSKKIQSLETEKAYRFVNLSRVFVVLFGLASVGFAFIDFGWFNFWVAMYSLMLSLFPAIYCQVSERLKARQPAFNRIFYGITMGATSSLVVGIIGLKAPMLFEPWISGATLVAINPFLTIAISAAITFSGGRRK
jgi:Na+/proline symporter